MCMYVEQDADFAACYQHEKNKEDTRTKGRKETETSRPRILAIRMQETIEKKFDLRMYQLIAYLHLNKDKDWPMI